MRAQIFQGMFPIFYRVKTRQDEFVSVRSIFATTCYKKILYIPRQEIIFGFKHHYRYILQPSVMKGSEISSFQ